jgi:hypothetical protein
MALLCCQTAQAKKFALINTGDELFEVAAFPLNLATEFPKLSTLKAGYKCKHFGVFWADVWTWDCHLVGVMTDESYLELPDRVVSSLSGDSQYKFGRAKRGVWNHYGFWVVLGGLLAFGVLGRVLKRS